MMYASRSLIIIWIWRLRLNIIHKVSIVWSKILFIQLSFKNNIEYILFRFFKDMKLLPGKILIMIQSHSWISMNGLKIRLTCDISYEELFSKQFWLDCQSATILELCRIILLVVTAVIPLARFITIVMDITRMKSGRKRFSPLNS